MFQSSYSNFDPKLPQKSKMNLLCPKNHITVIQKGCSDKWDAMIGWIVLVLHRLQSLLGAIELNVLFGIHM